MTHDGINNICRYLSRWTKSKIPAESLSCALVFAMGLFSLCQPRQCHAQSTTYNGTIKATLQLTSACQIGGTALTGTTDFGVLAFDTQTTFFDHVDKQVFPSGGDVITMTCSPDVTPSLTVTGGTNDAQKTEAHNHALANGTSYIAYDLYKDASLSTVVQNNTPISLTPNGNNYTINLFGRAFGSGSTSTLRAGSYSDTINITIWRDRRTVG